MRWFARLIVLLAMLVCTVQGQSDWPTFGHDPGGQRFSPLKQIDTTNVSKLKLAWSYDTQAPVEPSPAQAPGGRAGQGQGGGAPGQGQGGGGFARVRQSETMPLVVGNVMYMSTAYDRLVALEADTGREIWVYQLKGLGTPGMRGINYWPGDGQSPARIIFGTTTGKMLAVDANEGQLVPGFGEHGVVDLRQGVADEFPNATYRLSSPPTIYKNVIITGATNGENPPNAPSGDPRGWDAKTGKLLWRFHSVPQPGEPNHEAWQGDEWKNRGGANTWGYITVDVERGIVYVPLGAPNSDFWGGDRKGSNLYGSSLVALDAMTGKMKWYFQTVHHDNWDYDLPPAPLLLTVNHDGRRIPAVAQYSKQAFLYILDRVTGKPIFGIEERPVLSDNQAPDDVPWPTQPFPVKPPALTRQTFNLDEVSKVTPEQEKYCRELLATDGGVIGGGPYAQYGPKTRVVFPGVIGGGNWGGISFNPDLGYIFANSQDLATIGKLTKTDDGRYRRAGGVSPFWEPTKKWPCQQPPWGELSAVNANTGEIVWQVPLGEFDELTAKGVPKTGAPNLGGSIATAGGLVFIGATTDHKFRAFDARNGKELWVTDVGVSAHAIPITYQGRNGKQYVAVMASGGGFLESPSAPGKLFVYSLP
jgi:quinoprotein glucose dehydrogenase